MFCWSLFVLLYFFVWPLCCLSFFDIRIGITPLISSNCSYLAKSVTLSKRGGIHYELRKYRNVTTTSYVVVFFGVQWVQLGWELIVHLIDIGGIDGHYCLNFLYIIQLNKIWAITDSSSWYTINRCNQTMYFPFCVEWYRISMTNYEMK